MLKLISDLSAKGRLFLLFIVAAQVSGCSSSAERAQSYYEHGKKLLAQHDDQKAAIEFKNAVSIKRDLVPAWRALAEIEERNHSWNELVPNTSHYR